MCYDQGDHQRGQIYSRDALALFRESGDEAGEAWALTFLGAHALASPGECKEGIGLFEHGLGLFRELDDKPGIAQTLIGVGELARLDGDYERAEAAYEECLAIAREASDKMSEAKAVANLGYIAQQKGDHERAVERFITSIALFRELGARRFVYQCFASLAGPVAAQGSLDKATQLLGASEALLGTMGLGPQAGDRQNIARSVAAVRKQLDETAFAAAWAKGRAMSLEQAVSYALEVGQPEPAAPAPDLSPDPGPAEPSS
jgi:tetratricopeptide (TPR) repeat protein